MTFYIDVIFLENIMMNYIILFATGLIIKNNMKQIKLILSSSIGAIYAIMSYISKVEIYENTVVKFLLSIVMLYIAFKPNNIKKMFKNIIIFYLTSFCFGGAAYYLLYHISPEQINNMNGILTGSYPIKIAILGGILGFFILNIGFKVIKNRIDKNSIFYQAKIVYEEKSILVKVILDTGNLLIEPITGVPVMLIEQEKLKELLGERNVEIISNGLINNFEGLEEKLKLKCRIIPFSSVGKNNGMMIGFKPDYIKLYYDSEEITFKKVMIGICNNILSKNGNYSGLIGLELLNSKNGKLGELNEYNSNVKV